MQNPSDRFRQQVQIWEPHINAFAAFTAPGDLHSPDGPLAGLAVGVKDIIDVAGLPTRNGSRACAQAAPAPSDAAVVAALRAAGALIVGKTTTTEFAFTDPTACRNPFDLDRTPGGSSSGSGAAVAAGVVDIALGTQTAGSLVRPAAYCGVVGFKPTYGVLPNTGVTPLAPSFDSVGVIATSVDLAQRAFDAMAPAASGGTCAAHPRLGCALWHGDVAVAEAASDALSAATATCAAMGLACDGMTLEADIGPIVAAHRQVMNFEAAQAHGAMVSDGRADLLQPRFRAGLRAGAALSPQDATHAAAFLARAKDAFWAAFGDLDAVLTLPVPDGAPRIDGTTGFQDWLTPWTVFGGPLISLPWGLDGIGRPRAVMLAGKPGQDAALLALASRLEAQGPPRPIAPLPRP